MAIALTAQGLMGAAGAQAESTPQPGQTAWQAKANKPTTVTAATFADPGTYDKPWARWNWAEGWMSNAQIEADIQDAYDTNHGGLEIGQTSGNSTVPRSVATWETVYNKANALGMKISQKVYGALAPNTNNEFPEFTGSSDYARRTLAFGNAQVVEPGATVTYNAASGTQTIIAVLAYQCANTPCGEAPYVVDRKKVQNLTKELTGTNTEGYEGGTTTGTVTWTNTSSKPYVIKGIRATNYGTTPETLTKKGTDLLTSSYDTWFSSPVSGGKTLGDLVKANGGDFFVDSHGSDPWGVPYELWSSTMRSDFKASKGYDILTNIVALEGSSGGAPSGVGTQSMVFSDDSMPRIANDFYDLRSELFSVNRIQRFQKWANTWNMSLRIQHEDASANNSHDQATTAAYADRSEYESLIADDNHDAYRQMASGQWMTGNQWLSTECCAISGGAFMDDVQDTMIRMSKEFAGGVDRPVYHVRGAVGGDNTTWPGGGHTNTSKNGWSGFYSSIQPYHENFAAVNDYYARNGMVLRTGQAKVDVAVYMVDYVSARNTSHWTDTSLQEAGYTWGYLNDALLSLDNAKVTDGVLAKDGPGYKAMVFNQFITPDSNAAKGKLTTSAAEKMLKYAKAGLPIIFVGEPTGTAGLNDSDAKLNNALQKLYRHKNVHQVDTYAELTAKLKKLGIEPNLMPETDTHLLSMNRYDQTTNTNYFWVYNYGINLYQQQSVSSPTGSTIGAYTRVYENESSCFITKPESNSSWDRKCIKGTGTYKYSDNPVSAEHPGTWLEYNKDASVKVSLKGDGVPYRMDAYSGEITPITQYERVGDRVQVTLDMAVDDSTIIALADRDQFEAEVLENHAVDTTAAFTKQSGQQLVVAANEPGTYKTTLSSGEVVDTKIDQVPAAIDLSKATWNLEAEDWQPTNPYGTLSWAGSETTKKKVTATVIAGSMQKYSDRGVTAATKWENQQYEYLDKDGMLPSWYHIPGLQYASGVGTYTTTINLEKWDPSWSAILNLGEVVDSFTIKVNGETVPFVDQISATTDIGKYLKTGENTLSVRVTTTLNNRLYQLGEGIADGSISIPEGLTANNLNGAYTRSILTHYGLLGPVTIAPYATAVVDPNAIKNVTLPTITGDPEVGSTVKAEPGTWDPEDIQLGYQWNLDGAAIKDATDPTYPIALADVGKELTVTVTATKEGRSPASATSAPIVPKMPASVTVVPRTLSGKVYLSVSATNDGTVPVDIVISTEYGNKTFTKVAPGETVSASINSKLATVPAGEATVKVTATVDGKTVTDTRTVSYEAFPK